MNYVKFLEEFFELAYDVSSGVWSLKKEDPEGIKKFAENVIERLCVFTTKIENGYYND